MCGRWLIFISKSPTVGDLRRPSPNLHLIKENIPISVAVLLSAAHPAGNPKPQNLKISVRLISPITRINGENLLLGPLISLKFARI
jgi:hypothetical protein